MDMTTSTPKPRRARKPALAGTPSLLSVSSDTTPGTVELKLTPAEMRLLRAFRDMRWDDAGGMLDFAEIRAAKNRVKRTKLSVVPCGRQS